MKRYLVYQKIIKQSFINKAYNRQLSLHMSRLLLNSWQNSQRFSESRQIHPCIIPISQQLFSLKQQSKQIGRQFEEFKQQTINKFNKAMGRITSFIQRQISANAQLKEELDIVKHSNQTMCKQVMQLREMINDCVKSYNCQLEIKDAEIKQLKIQLGIYYEQKNSVQAAEYGEQKPNCLEVIQQVSQYTGSCLQSIRQISIPNSAKGSIIPIASNQSNLSETHEDSWVEQDKVNKSKSFLNFFRKTVDESVAVYQQKQKEESSHLSSVDDLNLGDTDKINIPKTIRSPKNMQLFKKSSKVFQVQQKQNSQYVQVKRTPHRRNHSQGEQKSEYRSSEKQSRSHSKAGSKEKIKITSKMIDESNSFVGKNTRKASAAIRPSVHLGGKAYLKKLIKQVKNALQEFKAWEGTRDKEVVYEGQKKNGTRWGKGKLLYTNGFEYEGSFVQNYKHGIGTISLNGMVFYEGQWSLDQISGQGYIKSLKNYCENCPKYLLEASYCGQLLENKMHGMGTLFLNQNEKIVSKFVQGIPVGDFTYYNRSEIEFGSWY